MKISIYGEESDTPREDELCLRLHVDEFNGRTQVIAVNPNTGIKLNAGVLLEFMDDGSFRRAPAIRAPGAGVQIDASGRMIESGCG